MGKKKTEPTKKAEFFYSPPSDEVTDVHLVGDFNDWEVGQTRMTLVQTGTWKASLSLSSGAYEYKFWVDGRWENDPECPIEVPNPFGTTNSKIDVL